MEKRQGLKYLISTIIFPKNPLRLRYYLNNSVLRKPKLIFVLNGLN